jgi:hypothetical protein
MEQSLNIKNLTRSVTGLAQTIGKFHYIILMCLIVAGMGFTIYYINSILNSPPAPSSTTAQVGFSNTFDAETIKKIDTFKYRDETTIPVAPSGRSNPFTE